MKGVGKHCSGEILSFYLKKTDIWIDKLRDLSTSQLVGVGLGLKTGDLDSALTASHWLPRPEGKLERHWL